MSTDHAEPVAKGHCAPGEHVLPETARPGQVTKCRTCRASVRVPLSAAAMMPVAEHEEKVAQLRARVETWKVQQEELIAGLEGQVAELEEKLARSAVWCAPHSREKLCPVCCGAVEYDF